MSGVQVRKRRILPTSKRSANRIFLPNSSSKPALTEGLEIDQYMWAILNTLTSQQETEEVMVDAQANWKAIKPTNGIKQEPTDDCKQFSKVMSPGSTSLPSWDNMQAMSPYMSPDMNSIASGSMMGQR